MLVLYSCANSSEQQIEDVATPSLRSDTITVASYISHITKLEYPIKVIGKVRSASQRKISFEKSGIISSLSIQNGTMVNKGQPIATLQNTDELHQMEMATIALKKSLVDFEHDMLAMSDSMKYGESWPKVKENVFLKTGVLSAKVDLKKAEEAYRKTIVLAPISGIVEGITLKPGDFVSGNQIFGSIYDNSSFEVSCQVLEYDILKVKKGMNTSITLLADPSRKIDGYVSEINPAVNEEGLSEVLIQLKDAQNILPGMSVRVEINVTDEPRVVVPLAAVVKRSERHVIFSIEDGVAKWNYVTLGKDNGEDVQVLDGLEENMVIVISNNLQMAHDSPVKIR